MLNSHHSCNSIRLVGWVDSVPDQIEFPERRIYFWLCTSGYENAHRHRVLLKDPNLYVGKDSRLLVEGYMIKSTHKLPDGNEYSQALVCAQHVVDLDR